MTKTKLTTFSITDSDVVAEWIYFAVLASHSTEGIIQLIDLTLASTFLKEPIISEAEIDEAIKMDREMLKENGEQLTRDFDRELIRQELITAGAGEQFEEGLAACEFLAALLGNPTDGFLAVIASYGEDFVDTFYAIAKQYDSDKLRTLRPKALTVITQSKNDKSAHVIGLSDKKEIESWIASLEQLETNLNCEK